MTTEQAGRVTFSTVVPRGAFYQTRRNWRVWCPHGELIWSTPGAERHTAEACNRLRERTGCDCEVER